MRVDSHARCPPRPACTDDGGYQYYAYLNFGNQVVSLGRFNGAWTKFDKQALPELAYGSPYRLRVVMVDCAISVFVDDVRYITADDCAISEGTVGLKSFGALATYSVLTIVAAR